MPAHFLLAFPRLHSDFAPPSPASVTLWPGHLHAPAGTWQPRYSISPMLATAILSDFKRSVHDGLYGSPVQALSLERHPSGLSPDELKALRELTGQPADSNSISLRNTAQQVLLLSWLLEEQALDMAALQHRIQASRASLRQLFSGEKPTETNEIPLPDEQELPPWNRMLAAVLAFFPDIPENTLLLINSRNMSDAISERFIPSKRMDDIPGTSAVFELTASDLLTLCPADQASRLSREPDFNPGRTIALVLPQAATN